MSWTTIKIGDLGRIVTGKTPPTKQREYFGGDYPFITPTDLEYDGYRVGSTITTVSDEAKTKFPNQFIPKNAITYTCIASVGKIGVATMDSLTNQQINSIIPSDKHDWRFVYYLLRHESRRIKAMHSGVAVPIINKRDFERIQIKVPINLATEQKIGSILAAYDDLIENNRRRIELLEKAARLIYEEWFIRFRFPGHENTKIVDGVPTGWNLTHLSEIFTTQYGYTETATNKPVGPKFLRGTDINKTSYIDWSTVPFCPEDELDFDRYSLQVGDIIVIRMADPGKVAIVETAEKAIFASYLVRLKQKPEVNTPPLYLFYALTGGDYPGFISRASGGTTRKSANARLLVSFEILIPPENVAKLFVEMVNPMRQQIQTLLRQNGALRQARDLLLPRLIARTIK